MLARSAAETRTAGMVVCLLSLSCEPMSRRTEAYSTRGAKMHLFNNEICSDRYLPAYNLQQDHRSAGGDFAIELWRRPEYNVTPCKRCSTREDMGL